jgi:hypothetical protein
MPSGRILIQNTCLGALFAHTRACGSQRWRISLLLDVFAQHVLIDHQPNARVLKGPSHEKLDLPENDVS